MLAELRYVPQICSVEKIRIFHWHGSDGRNSMCACCFHNIFPQDIIAQTSSRTSNVIHMPFSQQCCAYVFAHFDKTVISAVALIIRGIPCSIPASSVPAIRGLTRTLRNTALDHYLLWLYYLFSSSCSLLFWDFNFFQKFCLVWIYLHRNLVLLVKFYPVQKRLK